MKAIIYEEYGPPDVLKLKDIEMPPVGDDGVLVRVRAAALNPLDWRFMRGGVLRMMTGLFKPKTGRIGIDVAGEVEAVGRNVTQCRPGDHVFGYCEGALAEYVWGKEIQFAPQPANITFEQAAGINIAGCTSLQALRDAARLQPGQRVVINGASGGVGTFAVQIAKVFGAVVTGVCSTRNLDFVRSLGADDAIDYTKDDFTRGGRRYDLLLENVGNLSMSACRRLLNPAGIALLIGAPHTSWPFVAYLINAGVLARFARPKVRLFMSHTSKDDLLTLKDLIDAGKVTPVIDRTYPLSETAEAVRYLEQGHARGKVVITM